MKFLKPEAETYLGQEFCEVLEEVLKIREDRKRKYGDNFFDSSHQNLLVMAEEKINRFRGLGDWDDDDLIDTVNFVIFAICVGRRNCNKK